MDPHLLPINAPQSRRGEDVKDTRSCSKGNKRLFSHSFSRYSSQEEDNGSNNGSDSDGLFDEDDPSEKRSRTSGWPLGSNGGSVEGAAAYETDRLASPTGGSSDEPETLPLRSSKFIEGSMNNRVSQKPPRTYLAAQTELDRPDENESTKNEKPQRNKLIRHSNQSLPALSGEIKTGTNRQSTIFRFGKSLAASFNPSNWKIWSRAQDAEVADNKASAEAHAKLERAYKEVKNLPPTPGRRPGAVGSTGMWNNAQLHDSPANSGGINVLGVDISKHSLSRKRYGRVFMDPPSIEGVGHEDDPSKPSSPAELLSMPSHQLLHSNGSRSSFSNAPPHTLKTMPSRKDLRAQQKLVKRVSNLEVKLEAARLELGKSLGNTVTPQPVRGGKYRFVPGALASLPSESLLGGYTHQNDYTAEVSSQSHIGAALTTDERISLTVAPKHEETTGRRSVSSFDNTGPGSKKRKSIATGYTAKDGSYKPSQDPEDQDGESEQSQRSPVKKARSGPRKQSRAEPLNRQLAYTPHTLLSPTARLSAKGQENPRLIVKKRAASDTQGSRIPRKGSRKEDLPPTAPCDENTTRLAATEAASQLAQQQQAVIPSLPRHTTGSGAGKLRKTVAKPRMVAQEDAGTQAEPSHNQKPKETEKSGTAGGKLVTSESFEWGPDVF